MNAPRALVIGGSLGGLFAANMLRAIGWETFVFERVDDDLAGRGAGIGTHHEMLDVMRRLGLTVDASIGVGVHTRVCLDRSGRITHEIPMPQLMTTWARVYRPLKQLLPQDCYRTGKVLDRIEQDSGQVAAIFADGTRVGGDLLIGADGIRSSVRAHFAPDAEPEYAGYIAWRGVVEPDGVSAATRAVAFEKYTMCLPDGEMMLAYPVPGRDDDIRPGHCSCNFVWYHPVDERETLPELCTDAAGCQHGLSIAPPLIRPEVLEAMRADARARFAPQLAELVERAEQPFFQPIFDVESAQIVFGRVALLGDAAFVARPHVGIGVTKAALDAVSLADAIVAPGGDLCAARARYAR